MTNINPNTVAIFLLQAATTYSTYDMKNEFFEMLDKYIHAMDILNHARRHNLTEDTYNEIKSLIVDNDHESEQVKISENDEQLKIVLMSKNYDEIQNLFKYYGELFKKIDCLID